MTAQLLALTVGPVQEFIAAARRTRDLWFGSYLLSEISKAAAKTVQTHGGRLIFPAPSNDAELDCDSFNVANVILAELGESDPKAVAHEAKKAARNRWREFAGDVLNSYKAVISSDLWEEQVDDVIEFYAAWHPYTPQTYQDDRAALMRLLAARKRCRDFLPANGRSGVPKSSLDGLRESVLRDPKEWPKLSHRRLRLNEGEQLDVVGMVKRTWAPVGRPQRYPSVERVAADSWLRKVSGSPHFNDLVRECGDLNLKFGGDVVQKLDISDRGHPQYAAFPFEGTAVFRSRYREFCKEVELSDSDLEALTQALGKLTSKYGDPSPYLSVLVADGDRVGEALSQLGSPEEHRRFSRDLASFAAKARGIVDKHSGVLIYAGGDDLLAFVPLDRCLDCARELHDTFGGVLAEWSKETEGKKITLSVGLAIAHFMEPLEDLLEYGRAAEKHAKRARPEDGNQQLRDGLAVHLLKRGGGPLAVRANWSAQPAQPDKHLAKLADLITAKAVSNRIAYDLHKIASTYESWLQTKPEAIKDAVQRDTLSVMRGKQPSGTSGMVEIKRPDPRPRDGGPLAAQPGERTAGRQGACRQRELAMTTILEITCRDPIVSRDGRPFGVAQGNRMRSLDWLLPSVLAGALRTTVGKSTRRDFSTAVAEELLRVEVAGPFPLSEGRLYFPAPNDCIVHPDRGPLRAVPQKTKSGGGCDWPKASLQPVYLEDAPDLKDFKPGEKPAWWPEERLTAWLVGAEIAFDAQFLGPPEKVERTHVRLDPNAGAAEDGALFTTSALALTALPRHGVAKQPCSSAFAAINLAARVRTGGWCGETAAKLDTLHPLGGERRLVHWKAAANTGAWDCPQKIGEALAKTSRVRMVLATPAVFRDGWKPAWLNDELVGKPPGANVALRLVGVSIERWRAVSGWSLLHDPPAHRPGPKPVKRLVPAGGVYFFEAADGKASASDLAGRWLESVSDAEQDRRDGFGLAVWGIW